MRVADLRYKPERGYSSQTPWLATAECKAERSPVRPLEAARRQSSTPWREAVQLSAGMTMRQAFRRHPYSSWKELSSEETKVGDRINSFMSRESSIKKGSLEVEVRDANRRIRWRLACGVRLLVCFARNVTCHPWTVIDWKMLSTNYTISGTTIRV